MSKELLTVCIPQDASVDVPGAIGAAMAPYDYNRDPRTEFEAIDTWWDYWKIDGRGCEFMVLPGHEEDPRLIRGTETLSGQHRTVTLALCDGGPRALLDLDTPRAQAAGQERRAFEAWQAFSSAYPPSHPSDHFWAKHFADPEHYPVAQAIEDYRTQPVIAALGSHPELQDLIGGDPVARYVHDIEYLVRDAADCAVATQALLTLDGQWLSIMGSEATRYFNDYLDSLPADAFVVRVKYHG